MLSARAALLQKDIVNELIALQMEMGSDLTQLTKYFTLDLSGLEGATTEVVTFPSDAEVAVRIKDKSASGFIWSLGENTCGERFTFKGENMIPGNSLI